MGKKKYLMMTVAFLLYVLPSIALADVHISLKLRGALGYHLASGLNNGTKDFLLWGRTYFTPPSEGGVKLDYRALHAGYEWGGDIIFELSPKVGFFIGAGYLQISKSPGLHSPMQTITAYSEDWTEFFSDTKVTAIPLRLGLNLTRPLGRSFDFTGSLGIAYYLHARYDARLVVWQPSFWLLEEPWQITHTTAEKKRFPLGLQAGLGIEYKAVKRMAFFIEALANYARFRGLEGTTVSEEGAFGGFFPSFSEQGKLYYESVPIIPNAPRLIMVQSSPPAGPGGEPREAVVDFSSVSLQAGIRIRF
jgi:hypothetical protein